MTGTTKQSRAKQACSHCHAHRIRCDVMQKRPCSNCETNQGDCIVLPSRRGKYPRKRPHNNIENGGRLTRSSRALAGENREQVPPAAETSNSAPRTRGVVTQLSIPDTPSASSLFFGESNFLTLVPSSRPETVSQPNVEKGRLSFPIQAVPSPSSNNQTLPSAGIIHLSSGTERYLRDEGALTFPSLQTCLPVIQAYFQWFHPCFPVLDRPSIARRLPTMDISPLLLQAMLFIGATWCDEASIVAMGFRDRSEAKSLLYTRARLLFHADWEKDQMTLVQALFLMSFWRGESSDVRDVRYWLGVVITLAQTCGLHRSTKLTTRDARMARIRRRIWWSVYVRERQSAASLGLPMRIRDEDCDIEPLTAEDLQQDEDDSSLTSLGSPTSEHLLYPIKMVELARLLGKIIDLHFIPGRTPAAEDKVVQLRSFLEEWKAGLPQEMRTISSDEHPSVWTCLLQLAYHHLRILIHRNGFLRHDTHDTAAALHAACQISRLAEDMLDRRTLQYGQMHLITSLFAALCIHAINLKTADGVSRRLAENRAQICLLGLKEVQKSWRINNTVLDLFLQYLDESIASRLGGEEARREDKTINNNSTPALAAVHQDVDNSSPLLSNEPSQMETNSFEDQYFQLLSTNWEGEHAIDGLGLILDPQGQTQSLAGGPAQLDGLNLLERWL